MENRQILKEKLSLEVPEVRKTRMMEQLFSNELNENFSDLDFDEIRASDFYLAIHKHIIPLPTIKYLLEKHMSLKRSLDRKGRQEAVTILKKPVQYVTHYPYPVEEPKTSKFAKLKGLFKFPRRKAEEVEHER